VVGYIGARNQQTQIIVDVAGSITENETATIAVPDPTTQTVPTLNTFATAQDFEGSLVKIIKVRLVPSSRPFDNWPTDVGTTGLATYTLLDASGNNIGLAINHENFDAYPAYTYFDLVGILGRYNDTYRIYARDFDDIPKVDNVEPDEPVLPIAYGISKVYPNPMRGNASFEVNVKSGETAKLRIYNIKGQLVKEFPVIREGLNQKVVWNCKDAHNKDVASGVYFYRFSSQSMNKVNKMMVIK
jgi:hypothetical protein